MSEKLAKAVFGELTLGEVWESVRGRVDSVRVDDSVGETSFSTFHLVPGVKLGLSNHPADEHSNPDCWFALKTKVDVRGDYIELVHDDWFGEEERLSIRFLLHPEPQVIGLDFLLKG